MPYQEPDATDPMTLEGVELDAGSAAEARRANVEMAECFIDEFMRLGFSTDRIWRLFATAGYAGPHRALQALGEQHIRALIEASTRRWGPRGPHATPDFEPGGRLRLPVLDPTPNVQPRSAPSIPDGAAATQPKGMVP
ncbi:MAG: hypothetical protein CHACPFDD_03046 [Phycisphaerae bacterium]|nr:hypothetical protein [Phycisphaerae bacterium]